ncbi:hypothetical protein NDU88_002763 [Pleurodeles waltl]|uniref:Uncharacterized protein n=1 Tax=Pleurodeles waltl TaxID=8319 RepID=A0AAV7KUL9_PLEWA|nr:hypothetical protein NDU88_002763 [Pleurodeles waltl]
MRDTPGHIPWPRLGKIPAAFPANLNATLDAFLVQAVKVVSKEFEVAERRLSLGTLLVHSLISYHQMLQPQP